MADGKGANANQKHDRQLRRAHLHLLLRVGHAGSRHLCSVPLGCLHQQQHRNSYVLVDLASHV